MNEKIIMRIAFVAACAFVAIFPCAAEKGKDRDSSARVDGSDPKNALVVAEEGSPEYALIEACQDKDLARVRELVEKEGANPNSTIGGMPALTVCLCPPPSRKILRYLLAHGANPNVLGKPIGETPLANASMNRDLVSAKILLAAGADPNLSGFGMTPMFYARGNKDRLMMDLLLKAGASKPE